MSDRSLAYLKTDIGCFALIPPMRGDKLTPKPMLVRLDAEEIVKHEKELIDTQVNCTTTKSGARFCIFTSEKPKFQIEAMEIVLPSWGYSIWLKEKRTPTLREAIEKKKNAFLVIVCKPKSFCQKKEHIH